MKHYLDIFLSYCKSYGRILFFSGVAAVLLISFVSGIISRQSEEPFIKVVYREPANIFTIMDKTSLWNKVYCNKVYNDYWIDKIGLTKADQSIFKKYKKLRDKYFPIKDPEGPINLFVSIEFYDRDVIGHAFYEAETMEEAYSKLSTFMTKEEVKFLREFYAQFEKRYAPLLEESKKLSALPKIFMADLNNKELDKYLKKVARFYNSRLGKKYTVLYTWFPLENQSAAFPEGEFMIMQCSPNMPIDRIPGADIVVHEIIHTISVHQPLEQKLQLSEIFLRKFKGLDKFPGYDRLRILEEPLAVVFGQALYLKKFKPELYQKEKYQMIWYNYPWVSTMAQLLEPILEEAFDRGDVLSPDLIEIMSDMAKPLYQISINPNQMSVS